MASASDIKRARLGAAMTLADLHNASPSGLDRGDANLQSLLGDIHQRKCRQTARLWQWLDKWSEIIPEAPTKTLASEGAEPERGDPEQPVDGSAMPSSGAVTFSRPSTAAESVAIIDRIDVTADLIRFRVPRPLDFDFAAGQSVKVGLGELQRAYSIVSAPHEPFLEFFVELAPGGQMSEKLRHLKAGDRVSLGQAKGGFRLDESCPEHLMIATVTGINPFVSIVRDYLNQGRSGYRFHILHGASHLAELGYSEELASLAAAHPETLRYTPTVSRPEAPANTGWSGQVGRVDAIVDQYVRQQGLEPPTTRLYACGHSGMVDTVASRFQSAGYQVLTESYD